MNSEDLAKAYTQLEKELIHEFTTVGIKAWRDNKIVFGMSNGEQMIYFGFKDWNLSVGFGYYDENEKFYDGIQRGQYSYKHPYSEGYYKHRAFTNR